METLDYRPPRDDQGVEPPAWVVSRTQLNLGLFILTVALSAASLFVVVEGAGDEPYTRYRRYDAIMQVGVGTTLMVLWGLCSVAVVVLVRTRKVARAWLALLLWAVVSMFYLSNAPLGYLQDMERFVLPPAARSGWRPRGD